MRKAARVFLIIGMILGFYAIFPIILGIFALRRLNSANTTEDLKVWGILSIIFVSTLGGIFMLCVKQEELGPVPTTDGDYNESGYSNTNDPSERLIELKSLLDEGIIDEETYEEKRKKYLEEL